MNNAHLRPCWPPVEDDSRRRGRGGRGGWTPENGGFGPRLGRRGEDAGGRGDDDRGGRPAGRGRHGFGPMGPVGPGGPGGHGFGHGGFGPGGRGPHGFGPELGPEGFGGRRGRARRGDVRQAILALLAEQPLNGYQVIQTLAERTGGVWKPSPGAIYPALNQLVDEGLIEPHEDESGKGFRLTEAGRAAADAVEVNPWDALNEATGRNTEGAEELWREFAALAAALRSATVVGNPAQFKAATELMADTRRRLFGILAEDQPR